MHPSLAAFLVIIFCVPSSRCYCKCADALHAATRRTQKNFLQTAKVGHQPKLSACMKCVCVCVSLCNIIKMRNEKKNTPPKNIMQTTSKIKISAEFFG